VTLVKICGITNLDDALTAVDAGADALGFNFYARSPRYIAPGDAAGIIRKLPRKVMAVGIFVNQSLDEVEQFLTQANVDHVQLHGDESPGFVGSITEASGPVVIKALRLGGSLDPKTVSEYDVELFLLDAASPKAYGGMGDTFDWQLAVEFKKLHPEFFLAGGLTPDNVAEAVRLVRPFGVDVCSGVESTKGKKDHQKVAAFIENVRNAL
jgi:phosphoribosylanthranilate isomerase